MAGQFYQPTRSYRYRQRRDALLADEQLTELRMADFQTEPRHKAVRLPACPHHFYGLLRTNNWRANIAGQRRISQ